MNINKGALLVLFDYKFRPIYNKRYTCSQNVSYSGCWTKIYLYFSLRHTILYMDKIFQKLYFTVMKVKSIHRVDCIYFYTLQVIQSQNDLLKEPIQDNY